MADAPAPRPRSSRRRYLEFVRKYRQRRLDDPTDKPKPDKPNGNRRRHLREYLRWLRPHRAGLVAVFVMALGLAGLEMAEPLTMRFIVDRVLLDAGLDPAERLRSRPATWARRASS